jgi:hypothetical protein
VLLGGTVRSDGHEVRCSVWRRQGLFVLVVACLASGCAIGPAGTIAGRVSTVQGGWILETYVVGAHLRTGAAEPGLGLGATKWIYIFAEEEVPSPALGWYVLLLPSVPLEKALLRHLEMLGIDLHLSAPEPGITVGAQWLTVTRPVRVDEDSFREINFRSSFPADACVSTQRGRAC